MLVFTRNPKLDPPDFCAHNFYQMKNSNSILWAGRGYIWFSASAFLSVSLMAVVDPQSVMDLVRVQLGNPDALSSIRGIYGGVGFALVVSLVFLSIKEIERGIILLSMIWGLYAGSRILTDLMEGPLGKFGRQWLWTEGVLFLVGIFLLYFMRIKKQVHA
jgi:hypothetical protein